MAENSMSLPEETKSRFGVEATCASCGTNTAEMWQKNEEKQTVCNLCSVRDESAAESRSNASYSSLGLRKTSRSKSGKTSAKPTPVKGVPLKGKNRRAPFKKCCMKAPAALSEPVEEAAGPSSSGTTFRAGDVVSLVDATDGDTYYAQIRGLLEDQYSECCAVLTWLLPKFKRRNSDDFVPSEFILGPEEDFPRSLDCMEFVCHSPSSYYMAEQPYEKVLASQPQPKFGFMASKGGLQVTELEEKPPKLSDNVSSRPFTVE